MRLFVSISGDMPSANEGGHAFMSTHTHGQCHRHARTLKEALPMFLEEVDKKAWVITISDATRAAPAPVQASTDTHIHI